MPECNLHFKMKCKLNRMLPVHVVAQEEVVGLWWEASVFEQSEQVVILTVDIACKQNCSICTVSVRCMVQIIRDC